MFREQPPEQTFHPFLVAAELKRKNMRLLFVLGLVVYVTSQELDFQCEPGEYLSGFNRKEAGIEGRVSFECSPLYVPTAADKAAAAAKEAAAKAEEDSPEIDGPHGTFTFNEVIDATRIDPKAVYGLKCKKAKKPLNCEDITASEGCEEENSWLAGFEVFEIGEGSEVYIPYCCTAQNVRINKRRCKRRSINRRYREIKFRVKPKKVWTQVSCHHVHARFDDGTTDVQDMIFFATQCPYKVKPAHIYPDNILSDEV